MWYSLFCRYLIKLLKKTSKVQYNNTDFNFYFAFQVEIIVEFMSIYLDFFKAKLYVKFQKFDLNFSYVVISGHWVSLQIFIHQYHYFQVAMSLPQPLLVFFHNFCSKIICFSKKSLKIVCFWTKLRKIKYLVQNNRLYGT